MTDKHLLTIKSILLLAGSFIFAFLLGEMVHEFGHYLAHIAYGNTEVGVVLDPFGGAHMAGVKVQSLTVAGVTSAAGPLFNVFLSAVCFLLFFRKRDSILFPLTLWGPVAMVQEGVTFTLGLLTSGGDAGWIVAAGVPQLLILVVGLCFLCVGVGLVAWLLREVGIISDVSYGRKLFIVTVGMCSLMLIRYVHAVCLSPNLITENFVPLIFSLFLASIVSFLDQPVAKLAQRHKVVLEDITWSRLVTAVIMGCVVFTFQIVFYNV